MLFGNVAIVLPELANIWPIMLGCVVLTCYNRLSGASDQDCIILALLKMHNLRPRLDSI